MRLVEEVVEVIPGARATARRVAHADDFFFQGHFPGEPIVPAVILVELIAQTGGLAVGAAIEESRQGTARLRVAAIGPFKFPAAAAAGAALEADARVAGRLGGLFKIEGEVRADGRVVATGSLTLAR